MENRTLVRHELFPRLPLPPWRVVLFCLAASAAVADGPPDAALLDALLKQPAPPPDWRIQLSSPELVKLITEQPADDVPVDALVEFWSDVDNQHCPSRKAQQRLLEACEADPENLPALLRWMPAGEPSISDRVKGLYDRLSQRSEQTIDLGLIHDWLMRHTDFFREDLLKATREALGASNGYGLEENAQALVHLDPAAARTLLGSFLQGDNDFARTASLVWLHRLDMNTNKSQAAQWRAELQKVASDSAASPRARDYSVAGLMQTPWDGQEKWFLGLFHDASLGGLHEGGNILTPLRVTVKQNPDRWIPKLVSLVGGADRAAHNNAVRCLTEYPQERALRPLLPWLSDPNWADVQARREIRVNLPAADHLDAIAWIPAHGKILLRRAKEEAAPGIKPNAGPDRPEFHLLDPATGELTAVNGEFRPLVEARERELQTSATEFIVWAALPSLDPEKRETVVGRYDLRNFKFSPILHVPGVNFGSSAMWVDEATRKVTFTVNGDLIRLSLP
jgi:hypothetical protein